MNFSVSDLLVLSVLAVIAALYAAIRVGAAYDASHYFTPAKDARVHTEARSRRAFRWGK
jgi:hypothetical protein